MPQINAKHVAWIKSTAKDVNTKNLAETDVKKLAVQHAKLGSLNDMDIEALVLFVMMEASKSAYNDIKQMMEQMEAIRKQKEALRNAIQLLKDREADNKEMPRYQYDSIAKLKAKASVKPQAVTSNVQRADTIKKISPVGKVAKAELAQLKKELTDKADSLSEMSQEDQLQLQKMMGQKNQLEAMISNIMKKVSDTQNSIIGNLKAS